MTDILPWLIANWLMLAGFLAFLIVLIVGVSWEISWYFWRWVIEAERESAPKQAIGGPYGDNPHLPDDYWEAVSRKEAKRDAA